MKHRITAALERFSRAMLAPLSYLSAAGLLLVVGALLTSAPLAGVLPFLRWEPVQLAGRIIYKCLTAVISNLSVLFCTGLAAALAKREKHQAAFIALMSYLVYLTAGNVTLTELGLLAQPDALTGLYSAGQKMIPGPEILELCNRYQVPAFAVDKSTSVFMAEIIRWLNVQLAPMISIHGVLVDVFGEGVLIMGESGIGKSEAALELIKRGHRLVSDDVVEISRVSDITLVGTAPDITRHFIELRGIGIIDVKTLFGVESVKDTQSIDLVIKLEEWDKEKEYDRLGLEEEYIEFLGNKVVCHSLPIRPGRNLAIIVETAAVNHRQKKMGYNAAQELYRRVQANLVKKREEK